ncbi:MAG TPA: MBL fold metallo-hydrolase [Micropepsaceae bacterium]|jgi:ribonuclease BN (tRNA processing enzyme)|nr:MBL fold metallo-hydrolase [Micropepsaceae bacterium]
MNRSFVAGLLVLLATSSNALAQSCTGNPVAVQVLGSGAPGFLKDRSNTSYLVWVGNQAKILLDAGGGAYVRFGQSQAKFSDLSMILVSHLHPDHVSDLPGVLWSGRMTRNDMLPIVGPSGNEAAPSFSNFLNRLFDEKYGAFEVLSSTMGKGPGVKLDASVVDVTKQEPTTVFDRDGIKVTALGIPHGNLPTLAYRVETQGRTIVFSSDQNGTNPRFPDFAKGANLLVMHLAIGVGANNPNQALPAVVGTMAQSANPKQLILSHIAQFDLDAAVADVKKGYSGPLIVGADLQCTQVQ